MTAVEKLIRDGKTAVLISPGYGAGWSTWEGPADFFGLMYQTHQAGALFTHSGNGE